MARGDKENRKCRLTIRQEVSTDKFANQSFNNINPSIADDKILYVGNQLGTLSSKGVDKVIRVDNYNIATA